MNEDQLKFYAVVIIALIIRVISSPYEGLKQSSILVFTSLGCTVIFTAPIAEILNIGDQLSLVSALAALVTMTAMGVVKWLLAFVDHLPTDPAGIIKLIKDWRNNK